ncbi:MAG: hypothetical protein K2M43_03405 [Mycoplasmoidaceae bacterium]|nr:hypothetical protein [Mycoplasmoidaceae bacterium]
MSGSYENLDVPNTLISFAVCVDEANNIISPEFKQVNSSIIYVYPEKLKDGTLNNKSLVKIYERLNSLIKSKKIISAYSLKQKGIAEAISKMCLGN